MKDSTHRKYKDLLDYELKWEIERLKNIKEKSKDHLEIEECNKHLDVIKKIKNSRVIDPKLDPRYYHKPFDITDYLIPIIILLIFIVGFIFALFDDPEGIILKIILIKNTIYNFFYP